MKRRDWMSSVAGWAAGLLGLGKREAAMLAPVLSAPVVTTVRSPVYEMGSTGFARVFGTNLVTGGTWGMPTVDFGDYPLGGVTLVRKDDGESPG